MSSRLGVVGAQTAVAALLIGTGACDARPRSSAVDSASTAQRSSIAAAGAPSPSSAQGRVPAYLQPVFRALDTLLTAAQRDTLRSLTLDSGFVYRTHRLADVVAPMAPEWVRSPIGDTVIAHGERGNGTTVDVVLDLYQQHLRGGPIDLAGALRRVSLDNVSPFERTTVSVDSVLLHRDLDGSGRPDRLVRQLRKKRFNGQPAIVDRRLALYLDAASSDSISPAWAIDWDDVSNGTLEQTLPVAGGGTLLVFNVAHADADEAIVLHPLRGDVRELLRQQIDYGEGSFAIAKVGGRVVVTATGAVRIDGRVVTPRIQCTAQQWPASTLVLDDANRGFMPERPVCLPRR